jgi:hypothetical protein
MNRDEIIRMAREAEIIYTPHTGTMLERFAALVAAQEREECAKLCRRMIDMAIAHEREECAKLCELVAINVCDKTAQDLSFAIRAREKK